MKRKAILRGMAVLLGAICAGSGVALAASSPTVVTRSATRVTSSSAILRATVNPNGSSTSYQFQSGLTSSYGVASALRGAGSGTRTVGVQTRATGLLPGTVYHYRVVALSRYGSSLGADRTFKTAGHAPPGVITGQAVGLGTSFATLTGTVNPNGQSTSYEFQYGLSTTYSAQTVAGTVSAAAGPVTVSTQVQGLEPGALFHYRLVALHGTSVASYGSDQTLFTYPSPRPVPRLRATTRPHKARSKPYRLTTRGTVISPRSLPGAVACGQNANVKISYFFGRHRVAVSFAALAPNCTFATTVVFRHRLGRGRHRPPTHLRIRIHFAGNGYLAPATARRERVVLG